MSIKLLHSNIKHQFPISVHEYLYSEAEQLNIELQEAILRLESQYKIEHNASTDPNIATEGGFQSPTNMNIFDLKDSSFTKLKSLILDPCINKYVEEAFQLNNRDLSLTSVGWCNILRSGDWQRPHTHTSHGNLISGVYYVNTPAEVKPKGSIEFLNPNLVSLHHGLTPNKRIDPKAGMLLLFPPYHIHFVHPVQSKEPRIVVAFDVMVRKNRVEFVF